jgi:hypothetical protein
MQQAVETVGISTEQDEIDTPVRQSSQTGVFLQTKTLNNKKGMDEYEKNSCAK